MNKCKVIENKVAKGEIAHNQQFLPVPQWFLKFPAAEGSKCFCKWELFNQWKAITLGREFNVKPIIN